MSWTMKVIYESANGSKEIRRFPVTTLAGGNFFIATVEKIRQLYPALAQTSFTLYWQDPDGDRIAFSSCEEMQEAISYVTDGVLRVFVSERKENSSTQNNPQQKPFVTEQRQNQTQGTQPICNQGTQPICNQGTQPICNQGTQPICNQGTQPSGNQGTQPSSNQDTQPRGNQGSEPSSSSGTRPNSGQGARAFSDGSRIPNAFVFPPQPRVFFQKPMGGMPPGAGASASATYNSSFQSWSTLHSRTNTAMRRDLGIKVSYSFNDGSGNQQMNCHQNWWTMSGSYPAWDNANCRAHPRNNPGPGAGKDNSDDNHLGRAPENESPEDCKDNMMEAGLDRSAAPGDWTCLNCCKIHIPTSFAIPMPAPPSAPAPTTTATIDLSSPKLTSVPQPPVGPQESAGTSPRPSTSMVSNKSRPEPARPQTNTNTNPQIQQSLDQMLTMGFMDTDCWLTALLTEYNGDIGALLDDVRVMATQNLGSKQNSR